MVRNYKDQNGVLDGPRLRWSVVSGRPSYWTKTQVEGKGLEPEIKHEMVIGSPRRVLRGEKTEIRFRIETYINVIFRDV